jgi:uncharacterized small protein (DUF1192 family)
MQIHINLLKKEMERLKAEEAALLRSLEENGGLTKDNKT